MRRRANLPALLSSTIFLFFSTTALAQRARIAHPPPPAVQRFDPLEDERYFVRDAHDPRWLHRAPGAWQRGIDRGYVERMVRGQIPAETLDALEASGIPAPAPLTLAPPPLVGDDEPSFQAFASGLAGDIFVLEGDAQIVANTQNGYAFDHRGYGLQRVIQQVWSRLGDNFDFITVFTTFDDSGVAAYYMPLQQDTTGLGDCNPNQGETFGCRIDPIVDGARLQGFAFMNSLGYWRNWDYNYDGRAHDLSSFDASLYAVLGQEIGHRWGSGLRFIDPRTGALSKQLLGRDSSHWAAWVDTDASVMDGWDWDSAGDDGRFTLVDDMDRYSLLDLYAMGAAPVASPQPFFFIDGARFVPNQWVGAQSIPAAAVLQLPSVSLMGANGIRLQATGEQVNLTIQDIVNAEGVRCPDKDHAQKAYRQAVVLVTRPGQSAAQAAAEAATLQEAMGVWEDWWSDRTNRALTLCTGVDLECVHPEATLGRGVLDDEDGALEAGQKVTLEVPVTASGARIHNARLQVSVSGNGAEFTTLEVAEVALGDIAPDDTQRARVPFRLSADYPCASSVTVHVTLVSDNTEPVRDEYRLFPGYRTLRSADFDEGDEGFRVNVDGEDQTQSGAFERSDVQLSCFMTPRTPERDVSPGGQGAFITGATDELSGTTSLWSAEVDVAGAIAPEVRFSYWLDGQGGRLRVLVSRTGSGFTEARVYDEPAHGWSMGRIVLREVYPDVREFDKLHVAFVFEGEGRVEGGIDAFRVLDPIGTCAEVYETCACSSTLGSSIAPAAPAAPAAPRAGLLALALLAGACLPRRRSRA